MNMEMIGYYWIYGLLATLVVGLIVAFVKWKLDFNAFKKRDDYRRRKDSEINLLVEEGIWDASRMEGGRGVVKMGRWIRIKNLTPFDVYLSELYYQLDNGIRFGTSSMTSQLPTKLGYQEFAKIRVELEDTREYEGMLSHVEVTTDIGSVHSKEVGLKDITKVDVDIRDSSITYSIRDDTGSADLAGSANHVNGARLWSWLGKKR